MRMGKFLNCCNWPNNDQINKPSGHTDLFAEGFGSRDGEKGFSKLNCDFD